MRTLRSYIKLLSRIVHAYCINTPLSYFHFHSQPVISTIVLEFCPSRMVKVVDLHDIMVNYGKQIIIKVHVLNFFTVTHWPNSDVSLCQLGVIGVYDGTKLDITFPAVTGRGEILVEFEGNQYRNGDTLTVAINRYSTLQLQSRGQNYKRSSLLSKDFLLSHFNFIQAGANSVRVFCIPNTII